MINELSKQIHAINKKNGFWDDADNPKKIAANIALIHSEASEALEADREEKYCNIHEPFDKAGNTSWEDLQHEDDMTFEKYFEMDVKNTFEDELADIMIRVMDLAAFKQIDLEAHIKVKVRYNSLREYKHGKKY